MKNYKVTAECVVHVPTSTTEGATLGTLYRNSTFLGDPDSVKIKHLLDSGMIVELGKDGQPVKAKADEPADAEGGDDLKVNARSSRAELLAYATGPGGMSEDDANKLNNKQLIDKFVKAPAE